MDGKAKKIPMRMCVGCRQMHEKRQLVRIVKAEDGTARIDKTGKASGRGAYVCKNPDCLAKAIKSGAIRRALSLEKTDEEFFEELKEAIV